MVNTNMTKKSAGATNSNGQHAITNEADFRSSGPIQQAHEFKAIATQLARLALAGHTVHRGRAGDFTVCKYGMSRYCADFAELQAFVRQLGVSL